MKIKDIQQIATTNYTLLVAWRIALVYILLAILRGVFFIYNRDMIGELDGELWALVRGAVRFDSVSVYYTNSLWLLLALLPLRSRFNPIYQRVLFWLYVATNTILITTSNLADTIYFHYASKRFSGDEMMFADNGNNMRLAGEFALDNWWMIPLAALLTFALAKLYCPNAKSYAGSDNPYIFYPVTTAVLLGAATIAFGGVRGGISADLRPITLSNTMDYTTDGAEANLILSNPFCIIRTLGNDAIVMPNYFDDERLEQIYTPYHYPRQERVEAATHKGYNVMIFILESFSAENSALLSPDLHPDGVGYMPFLDSLLREGVTLRKNYANGTQSVAGTPSVLGSIPSLKKPFVLLPHCLGESYQMPAVLRDKGYTTTFFCGSTRASMGFSAYTKSAGVDNYVAREDYEQKYGYDDFDGSWGIWDEKFTQFVGEELSSLREPFFATQFTISSHHPFLLPAELHDRFAKEGTTRIQPVIAYTDYALSKFFDRFKEEEWFKRTIFVFSADHVSSEKMAERSRSFPGMYHIYGGYYTADGSLKGEITEVTQQTDYMPTILALLGNDTPYFSFGRDIFDQESKRPHWNVNYSGELRSYDSQGNILNTSNSDELKAFEQQYYKHLLMKSYVVPEQRGK
ncbi:MAG: LTA synthase family protein [Rikenellaceae bacterium]